MTDLELSRLYRHARQACIDLLERIDPNGDYCDAAQACQDGAPLSITALAHMVEKTLEAGECTPTAGRVAPNAAPFEYHFRGDTVEALDDGRIAVNGCFLTQTEIDQALAEWQRRPQAKDDNR